MIRAMARLFNGGILVYEIQGNRVIDLNRLDWDMWELEFKENETYQIYIKGSENRVISMTKI